MFINKLLRQLNDKWQDVCRLQASVNHVNKPLLTLQKFITITEPAVLKVVKRQLQLVTSPQYHHLCPDT